jgi:hypothetical protein
MRQVRHFALPAICVLVACSARVALLPGGAIVSHEVRAKGQSHWMFVVSPANEDQAEGIALAYPPPFPYKDSIRLKGLKNPSSVAAPLSGPDAGDAFVADESTNAIDVFAPPYDGKPIASLPVEARGSQLQPEQIFFDGEANLYVVAYRKPQWWTWLILRFSPPYARSTIVVDEPQGSVFPDVALADRQGNLLLGSELFGSVSEFEAPSYREKRIVAQVQWLRGLALGAKGHLFVEDGVRDRVLEYGEDGNGIFSKHLATVALEEPTWSFGCTEGSAPEVHGNVLAVDAGENFFVPVAGRHRTAVAEYANPAPGWSRPRPARTIPIPNGDDPLLVSVDPAEDLYVAGDTSPPIDPGILAYAATSKYARLAARLPAPKCASSIAFY